jgi:hypothetical protein
MSPTSTSFRPLDQDYLTTFPTEILIKILSEVPISSFLDILHTSSRLRAILKSHAAVICNLAIKSRFWRKAKCLNTKLVSGWSVPNHPLIFDEELLYKRQYKSTNSPLGASKNSYINHYAILGPITSASIPRFLLNLAPGPQFLYFLEYLKLMTEKDEEGGDWWRWGLTYGIDSYISGSLWTRLIIAGWMLEMRS